MMQLQANDKLLVIMLVNCWLTLLIILILDSNKIKKKINKFNFIKISFFPYDVGVPSNFFFLETINLSQIIFFY